MPTEKCPNNDGECSYPTRALVFSPDGFSVVTSDAAERLATTDDLTDPEPVSLPAGLSYNELVDLVLEARRAESPRDDPLGSGLGARHQVREIESTLEAFGSDADERYVIVNCSPCGHLFKKRIP